MASLRTTPGSSTTAQRKRLVQLGRKRGMDVDAVRGMVGGSLRDASSAAMSAAITRLGGGGLPNPPGQPKTPKHNRKTPGIYRMISDAQIEQIDRLMLQYFDGDVDQAANWLENNTVENAREPRKLGTAKRGGEVIAVLKVMHDRKERKQTC